MKTTDELKAMLQRKKKNDRPLSGDYLSTGSTLLNLACTGKSFGGFLKGHYYFLVGDSISGKTWLALTCLAEASINPNFKEHRFIYDNGEDGAMMDVRRFFGQGVYDRLEPPEREGSFSTTIEEFYYHVDDAFKQKNPFIYILDSMDSLSSESEADKFQQQKTAYRKGREVPGSYGDGKAKFNSANLRRLLTPLRESGSILIIISQTRDNLGFGFEKKSRSGGRALRFYACLEMWSSVKQKIQKDIQGKKRQLGVLVKMEVKKNRITGRERSIEIPIYHSFGIDDVGSCVDYLIDEGHWQGSKTKVVAPEFDFKGHKQKLIRLIEKKSMELDLRDIVSDTWNEIENACELKRKRRYE